jgi:hypothetical protein
MEGLSTFFNYDEERIAFEDTPRVFTSTTGTISQA